MKVHTGNDLVHLLQFVWTMVLQEALIPAEMRRFD